MTQWILIIWMAGGSSSVPAIPLRVDAYQNQETCEAAAAIWRNTKVYPDYATRVALCLPGGKWTGVK